jgi:hypothetical protein
MKHYKSKAPKKLANILASYGMTITNNMNNFQEFWTFISKSAHQNVPNPSYVSIYKAYTELKTTRAIIQAGIKEKVIRQNEKMEVAFEDCTFWNTLSLAFDEAKKAGIIKEKNVLGFAKYEVYNIRESGVSTTQTKTKIMYKVLEDFLEVTTGIKATDIQKLKEVANNQNVDLETLIKRL